MNYFIFFITTMALWIVGCCIGDYIGVHNLAMPYIMLYGFFVGGMSMTGGMLLGCMR